MRPVELAFAVGWGAFWLYWLVAAFRTKRGQMQWGKEARIRVVLIAVIVAFSRLGAFHGHALTHDRWREGAGLALFAAGLLFAIWARLHIGRNWGTPMTRKPDPELVTSGPYRFVRHPIYAGILAAGVGTAVGLTWWWLAAVAVAGIYFLYAAKVEEGYLAGRFPGTYAAYKSTTKMLVPFLL